MEVLKQPGALIMPFQEMLTAQHRMCDVAFGKIEQAALRKEWTDAATVLQAVLDETESQFNYEKHVRLPALEAAMASAAGPTSVMRKEHAQMHEFFDDLRRAVETRDARLLPDPAETLLFLMRQHDSEEASILYPVADRMLSDDLLARFKDLKASG
jgi:hypothetical protein